MAPSHLHGLCQHLCPWLALWTDRQQLHCRPGCCWPLLAICCDLGVQPQQQHQQAVAVLLVVVVLLLLLLQRVLLLLLLQEGVRQVHSCLCMRTTQRVHCSSTACLQFKLTTVAVVLMLLLLL